MSYFWFFLEISEVDLGLSNGVFALNECYLGEESKLGTVLGTTNDEGIGVWFCKVNFFITCKQAQKVLHDYNDW